MIVLVSVLTTRDGASKCKGLEDLDLPYDGSFRELSKGIDLSCTTTFVMTLPLPGFPGMP